MTSSAPVAHRTPFETPIGVVVPYAGPLAETDARRDEVNEIRAALAGQGWLYCDGQAYSCLAYPQLYAVIGTSFGGDHTTFNVPDLRGRFMRGVDGRTKRDPDGERRDPSAPGGAKGDHVGSLQADALQRHEHRYTSTTHSRDVGGRPEGALALAPSPNQTTAEIVPHYLEDYPRIASETRPVNLAFNYLIRYR